MSRRYRTLKKQEILCAIRIYGVGVGGGGGGPVPPRVLGPSAPMLLS